MNEYLSAFPYGSPGFTDVFPDHHLDKYRDSPLSPKGVEQAQTLGNRLGELAHGQVHETLSDQHPNELNEIDLIVVSPLTRALQTLEIALLPHIQSASGREEHEKDHRTMVPIVALPYAAERLYLVSDIGKTRQELHEEYGHFVDFPFAEEKWWFEHDSHSAEYGEWRPSDGNQTYACPGEPQHIFDSRMEKLYKWIEDRDESTIAVISHWGVIDSLLQADFANCELRVVKFEEIKPAFLRLA